MAEDRKITPEKQLLKLIEDTKGGAPAEVPHAALKRTGAAALSSPGALLGALKGRFSFFDRTARKKIAISKRTFQISSLNNLLMIAVAVFGVFLVVHTAATALMVKRRPYLAAQAEKVPASASSVVSPLKAADYYLQKITARDIFKEGSSARTAARTAEPAAAETDEQTKDLALVGISWSANPDAIIEDKAKQRTYFVKKGQTVGESRVEAIFKDRVLLSHDGREFELR